VPLIMSLLPPLTAMQQLPLWKVAIGLIPFSSLYDFRKAVLCVVKSTALIRIQPSAGACSASYRPKSTSAARATATSEQHSTESPVVRRTFAICRQLKDLDAEA
jgi:hypothetical protein